MKKILFILLFSCIAGAFAETGYNGHQWWTSRQVVKDKLLYRTEPTTQNKTDEEFYIYVEVETKTMLGIKTNVYYHFFEKTLSGVTYSLPPEKTKELKTKYKDKVKELEIEYKIDADTEVQQNASFHNFIFNAMTMGDTEYISGFEGKGNRISIYNYNDDTRVYILEDKLHNKTFVAYMYHEQDY